MTLRQRILKWIYPLFVRFRQLTGQNKKLERSNGGPVVSFYDLSAVLNDGTPLPFRDLEGQKVLIVNTASNCGYTNQYAELQQLHERYKGRLLVLAFPSNDFKGQEKGNDEEIARFCRVNFGVSFPLVKKSVVRRGPGQHQVFDWLTHKELNGWNDQAPTWNFSKYLVNESGALTNYYDPAVSPLDPDLLKALD